MTVTNIKTNIIFCRPRRWTTQETTSSRPSARASNCEKSRKSNRKKWNAATASTTWRVSSKDASPWRSATRTARPSRRVTARDGARTRRLRDIDEKLARLARFTERQRRVCLFCI